MNNSRNKTFTLLMLGGIAVCAALLPWSRWFTDPDAKLTSRIAEYVQLRKEADWVKLYAMHDARDRKVVALPQFLALVGNGPLKVLGIEESKRTIDIPNGTADVEMSLDAELQIDKLPVAQRRSLKSTNPADLRKTAPLKTAWYWQDGNWWLRMEPEAVTGRSADGKEVRPVGG